MRRHTPGPWYGDPMGTTGIYSGELVERQYTGHLIASVEGPTAAGPGSYQEYAANHRLVLTAPRLLDVIESALLAEATGAPIDIEGLRRVYSIATGEARIESAPTADEEGLRCADPS